MHPALVRLPVAVALAVPLLGVTTSAMAAPESAAVVQQDTTDHDTTEHDPAPADAGTDTDQQGDGPALEQTAPIQDMEGMAPMEGMDHSGAGEDSTHDEGHDAGTGSEDTAPRDTGGVGAEHDSTTGEHGDGGHADEGTASAPRPLAAALSTFAGVNSAVLVAAAVLRRRDRARPRHRPRAGATPFPA
ncbi:hypothetical protein Cfla_3684 [Cellulomonas flavigena DSM 20109]|uniref:Uncharacterized protein n=1 Tax=Cellulomonas flavigena (strain ATCC 482 / DSM 20109 / BCRC 11376 / JCM 18109 / NBRC 3775 / NCIMB 8073 / NRS 134) TaxID=446466 RepID=D5UE77_CELFN|nr:hypothetical protein [Cellulomonas flavigena]ADG76553.1 hypothetical protein Cfla_3684 [Cellulomonas flavigena DSM 20109]